MDISQIGAVSSAGTTLSDGKKITSGSDSSLGMNDFFQLLSAELQYQDPSNPTSNDQYMEEMAQFSTLEAIQNLSKVSNYSLASNLNGKMVSYNKLNYDSDTNSYSTEKINGNVEAVDFSSDTPECYVTSTSNGATTGEWVNYSDITQAYASDVTDKSGGTSTTA